MTGDFEHLSNTELADRLSGYHLYGTRKTSEISGTVMLKLIQQRLRATEPKEPPEPVPTHPNETTLSIFGERIRTPKD